MAAYQSFMLLRSCGFIVIDDPRALSVPMPDNLKPPPNKVEREEQKPSTGTIPDSLPKVCQCLEKSFSPLK